jgi:hypothetical protein
MVQRELYHIGCPAEVEEEREGKTGGTLGWREDPMSNGLEAAVGEHVEHVADFEG